MSGIVVGVDGSDHAADALVWAARVAELRNEKLTALMAWGFLAQHHTVPTQSFDPHYDEKDALEALTVFVVDAVGPERAAAIAHRVVNDLPSAALRDASVGASLLVVGARGLGGFKGLLLGSVSEQVVRHADCPVVVVRPVSRKGDTSMERIVVGIDGSAHAQRALEWAVEEARLRKARLDVVVAWHVPYTVGYPIPGPPFDSGPFEEAAEKTLDDALAAVDLTGVEDVVHRRVLPGSAASTLLAASKDADLVVVGSRGLGGFTGLVLGSVSHQVVHHAECPVVVVRTKES